MGIEVYSNCATAVDTAAAAAAAAAAAVASVASVASAASAAQVCLRKMHLVLCR